MKAIPSVKFKTVFFLFALSVLLFFSFYSFAEDETALPVSQQLSDIQKKLKDSEKREEEILANQSKILDEIQKTRVWLSHRG